MSEHHTPATPTSTSTSAHSDPPAQRSWYNRHYKHLLIVPAVLLILSIGYLIHFSSVHGDIIRKDVSLTGGTTITVSDASVDAATIRAALQSEFSDVQVRGISDIRTGQQQGFIVESKAEVTALRAAVEREVGYPLTIENSSIEFTNATLSTGFYQQLRWSVIVAFILMSVVVFIIFRTFVPSAAVVLAAFADILMTLALVNMFGMEVSIAGIVAFLMLIGYSVDTDILLTSRLLKEHDGTVNERLRGAFKTGMTMTLTAIAAVGASLVVMYSYSDTLRHMFTIILIGLGFDIFNTWIMNASILKWYIEVKNKA